MSAPTRLAAVTLTSEERDGRFSQSVIGIGLRRGGSGPGLFLPSSPHSLSKHLQECLTLYLRSLPKRIWELVQAGDKCGASQRDFLKGPQHMGGQLGWTPALKGGRGKSQCRRPMVLQARICLKIHHFWGPLPSWGCSGHDAPTSPQGPKCAHSSFMSQLQVPPPGSPSDFPDHLRPLSQPRSL